MKFNDFNWNDIILEAPGDDDDTGDELAATDYAESDVDIEEGDPSGEEAPEEAEGDDLADEDPLADEEEGDDPADEDPLSDEGDDPADEDPLADEEGESEEGSEEEQTDNAESDVSNDIQNKNLVNDYIELYNRIDTIMNQIRTDCKTNIRYNPNMLVIRRNLTKLKEITYDYIINKFAKESYVANLYQFNLIIQALNVNIDLLSSLMDSNRKAMEKDKKKDKKKETKKK